MSTEPKKFSEALRAFAYASHATEPMPEYGCGLHDPRSLRLQLGELVPVPLSENDLAAIDALPRAPGNGALSELLAAPGLEIMRRTPIGPIALVPATLFDPMPPEAIEDLARRLEALSEPKR